MTSSASQPYSVDWRYIKKVWREITASEYLKEKIDAIPEVVDNVHDRSTDKALSANQWRLLQDQIDELKTPWKFLGNWNASTWLTEISLPDNPYVYWNWDYFVVSVVSQTTNYKPEWIMYTEWVASQTVETETIWIDDRYMFNGNEWILIPASQRQIAIDQALSSTSTNPVENRVIKAKIDSMDANIKNKANASSGSTWEQPAWNPGDIYVDEDEDKIYIKWVDSWKDISEWWWGWWGWGTYVAWPWITIQNNTISNDLVTSSEEGIASVIDDWEAKNLFDVKQIHREVIWPVDSGDWYFEGSRRATALNVTNVMWFFMSIDQTHWQNQKLYSCKMEIKRAGTIDIFFVNLGWTGTLSYDMLPTSTTLEDFRALTTKAFTIAPTSTGVKEFVLDWTDPEVTYINPAILEDWYPKLPVGSYIAYKDPTGDTGDWCAQFGYGAGSISEPFYFIRTNNWWETWVRASTSSSGLWISWNIISSRTIVEEDYSFDDYLIWEETTSEKQSVMLANLINNQTVTACTIHGIYVFNSRTQWLLNNNIITGVELYPRAGKTIEFVKISVPDNTNITAGANADVAAMRAGSTIPSQYVLFRIVSDIGDGTQKVFFALDGSDPRVEIVDTTLYDSVNGWFPCASTRAIAISDWLNSDSSTAYPWTALSSAFFFRNTWVTSDEGRHWFHPTTNTWIAALGSAAGSLFVNFYKTEITTVTEEVVRSKFLSDLKDAVDNIEPDVSPLKGKWISFLGDSITTFSWRSNIAPNTWAAVWYPHSPITNVDQTYWKKLIDRTGMKLLVNNSWSWSRCANSGSWPVVSTSNDRCKQLHKTIDGVVVNPDYIVINIGTNDFDNNVWLGTWNGRWENFPANPDTTAPTTFREAYSVMLHRIRKNYPLARVFCCTIPCGNVFGDNFNEKNGNGVYLVEWNDAIREVATAYWAKVIELATSGLDYYTLSTLYVDGRLHPSEAGMERYYEIVRGSLEWNDSNNVSCPRRSSLMNGTASAVSNSTATDVAWIVTDFNNLLSNLRTRWIIN